MKHIYKPKERPMRVVLFSSSGPGNTQAILDLMDEYPKLIKLVLCVCDRAGIPTIEIAKERSIETIVVDFDAEIKKHSLKKSRDNELKKKISERLHDDILSKINAFEYSKGKIDLAVLAYRRIITGKLFSYFSDRMINQHPADLSIFDTNNKRKYVGIGGHHRSLEDDCGGSKTSCILVNERVDSGEILAQGKFVKFDQEKSLSNFDAHEILQKKVSDWPVLRFVLKGIAQGKYGVSGERFEDGCRIIKYEGNKLGYSGMQLS